MRERSRAFFILPLFALACLLSAVAAVAAAAPDQIDVVVDQAKLVKLPDRIATLVVGNPMIADVTLQVGGMMIVTGKGYGSTNVIAMDREGRVLTDRTIQVTGPSDNLVTVYRGVDRETYSCTPVCQRRITLGDGQEYFSATLSQAGTFSGTATGSAATAAANTAPAPRN
jgi:hypothetical protein